MRILSGSSVLSFGLLVSASVIIALPAPARAECQSSSESSATEKIYTCSGSFSTEGTSDGDAIYYDDLSHSVTVEADANTSIDLNQKDGKGIFVGVDDANKAEVTFDGTLEGNKSYLKGIMIRGDEGNISVINDGDITMKSDYSEGLDVESKSGATHIINTGLISVEGDDSKGVSSTNKVSGSFEFVNQGTIKATGRGSKGIYLRSYDDHASTTITNSGIIESLGVGGHAIFAESPKTDATQAVETRLVNEEGGIIRSEYDFAISFNSQANSQSDSQSLHTYRIENAGTISNGIVMSASADTIINQEGGVIEGGVNAVNFLQGDDTFDNAGTLSGTFDLGEGDDHVIMRNDYQIDQATIKSGDGYDTVSLSSDNQDRDLTFSGFEAFERYQILSGAYNVENTIAGDFEALGGSLFVEAGQEVQVDGDLTLADGASLTVAITKDEGSGHLNVAETATFAEGSTIILSNDDNTPLIVDQSYTVVTAATLVQNASIEDNSAILDFTSEVQDNKLIVTAKLSDDFVDSSVSGSNTSSDVELVKDWITENASDAGDNELLTLLMDISDQNELNAAMSELVPSHSDGAASIVRTMVASSHSGLDDRFRLHQLNRAGRENVLSSFAEENWQSESQDAFISSDIDRFNLFSTVDLGLTDRANQDQNFDDASGYSGHFTSMNFGAEVGSSTHSEVTFGAMLSYQNTGWTDDRSSSLGGDTSGFSGLAYGLYSNKDYYVGASFGLTKHKVNEHRRISWLHETASSSYDYYQGIGRLSAGFGSEINGMDLWGRGSLATVYNMREAHKETGSIAALTYDELKGMNINASIGAELGFKIDLPSHYDELKARISYDLDYAPRTATYSEVSFLSGGTPLKLNERSANALWNVFGAGLAWSYDNTNITLDAEYETDMAFNEHIFKGSLDVFVAF